MTKYIDRLVEVGSRQGHDALDEVESMPIDIALALPITGDEM